MPRPYECVRRAWHSDRHHPIRGSLIQEIFRIVNEVHCSATRKNSEWQEKLPVVVLKAEEIMYCKANSQAEYLDLQSLWNRVNDAVNTIIRRDESSETGELLQPCIEAALYLGCTPQRSSRSQRKDTPRYYLRPEKIEGACVLDGNLNTKVYGNYGTINPLILHCPPYSTSDTMNPLNCCLRAQDHSSQSKTSNHINNFPLLPKNFTSSDNHNASAQISIPSDLWSVYPLCYSNQIQPDSPKFYSSKPSNSNSYLMENDKTGLQQKFTPFKLDSLDGICPSNYERTLDKECGVDCDLTLRLGSVVVPWARSENSCPLQVENGNGSTLKRRKFKNHQNI